ncbi:LLM class F420-dependent oxidoreductase [Amycolatopsis sp. NPDC023774]|uniref:LLM class F420-dependent oxidoreductase n=1 Tax=Amycolatopsis sp. NPDC023774 TaxID=3155015 RepID=UPI0033C370F8
MTRPVRIGAHLWPGGAPSYKSWRDAVLRAEDMGVDVVFGYDHFHKPFVRLTSEGPELLPEQPDVANFEAWTALAAWAEMTTRVEIGTLVTGMGYRNPDLLADMARTVDHISGGRLILGVGSGWYEKDYSVYGYDYGTVKSRMDHFADGLRRIEHRLAQLNPPPVRPIPILIGGSGEKRTLPLVGRHATIWHSFLDLDTFRRKDDLVRQFATEAGRDERVIERSIAWPGDGGAADGYAAAGVTLYTTEIHPTDLGYDLSPLKDLLAWRDNRN